MDFIQLYDIYLPHHFKNKKEQCENLRRSADDFHVARFAKYLCNDFQGCQFPLDLRERTPPQIFCIGARRNCFWLKCAKPPRAFSKFCSSRKNKFEFFLATSLRVGITS